MPKPSASQKDCTHCGLPMVRVGKRQDWCCKPCRASRKREWRSNNTQASRYSVYKARLKFVYKLTPEELDAMIDERAGKCDMCGKKPDASKSRHPNGRYKLVVDHDHETNLIRGLLCHPCNMGLGFYEKHRTDAERYLNAQAPK